jgi:UTP-glucose-1-phosphate uridylyltransferase
MSIKKAVIPVDEIVAADISEVGLVTGRGKSAIEDFFRTRHRFGGT